MMDGVMKMEDQVVYPGSSVDDVHKLCVGIRLNDPVQELLILDATGGKAG